MSQQANPSQQELVNTNLGALAYGVTSGHAAIPNWKLLFIVEGAPTIIMAFISFFFLPDSPEKARFLNEEEKEVAKARAISQVGTEGSKRIGGVSLKDVGAALVDIPNWLTAVCFFTTHNPQNPFC